MLQVEQLQREAMSTGIKSEQGRFQLGKQVSLLVQTIQAIAAAEGRSHRMWAFKQS